MPASAAQNRILFLGVGVGAVVVIRLMRSLLIHYRDSAVIPWLPRKPTYINQKVEDSLKHSTLATLLQSPHYTVRCAATKIICERAIHDEAAVDEVLSHIAQPDYEVRERAIEALTMMVDHSNIQKINKPKTYAALIKSLEYSVMDYEHQEWVPYYDSWALRDPVEKKCLQILISLTDYFGVEGLVKGKFIQRWLIKEPWGETTEDRQIQFLNSLENENMELYRLFLPLVQDTKARKQLEDSELIPKTDLIPPPSSVEVFDTRMVNGEDTAGEDFRGMSMERRRRRNQSLDEDHLRRRHREAMVLNDGTQPLSRGDIFERER